MVKAQFSNSFRAKQARIKRIPKMTDDMLSAVYKKHAVGVILEYQNGIRTNSLGLAKLQDSTQKSKSRLSMPQPQIPLYGRGDDENNSLINCMRIVKLKNGWRVRPRSAFHHSNGRSKKIKLADLHKIHENGAIIVKTKPKTTVGKYFGGEEGATRIPPRPAFKRAYRNYLRKMKQHCKITLDKQIKI